MKESFVFSAPSRTEISGNHADHLHGCVVAAACVSGSTQEQSITRLETVDSDNMSAE